VALGQAGEHAFVAHVERAGVVRVAPPFDTAERQVNISGSSLRSSE